MVIHHCSYRLKNTSLFVFLALLALSDFSYAHVSPGQSGLIHPISGLDHALAMVAVGAWSSILGRRAVWMVPAFFVFFMVIGGIIGVYQIEIPSTEQLIALSVIVLGLAITFKSKISIIFATFFTALFGVFHGFAHGYELPVIDDAIFYFLGFVATTAFLHILGLIMGSYLIKSNWGTKVLQVSGAICTALGAYIFIDGIS